MTKTPKDNSSEELQRICRHIGMLNEAEVFALIEDQDHEEWCKVLIRERGFWIRAAWRMRGLNCSQHSGLALHIKNEAKKRKFEPPMDFGELISAEPK